MQKRIGEFLVEKGLIQREQIGPILEHSSKTGLRFGDAALDLKILTPEKLSRVFGRDWRTEYVHLSVDRFPASTKSLLSPDEIVRMGAIPLGFKSEWHWFKRKKRLNIGMLNPRDDAARENVEKLTQERAQSGDWGPFSGIKVYLVLADPLIEVLKQCYGLTEESLRNVPSGELNAILKIHLGEE